MAAGYVPLVEPAHDKMLDIVPVYLGRVGISAAGGVTSGECGGQTGEGRRLGLLLGRGVRDGILDMSGNHLMTNITR